MSGRKYSFGVTMTITPGEELLARLKRIGDLSKSPAPIVQALRRAAAHSLLREYRKRFTAAVPDLVNTEKYGQPRESKTMTKAQRERLDKAQEALSKAMLDGSRSEVRQAHERLKNAIEAINERLQNPPPNPLSTGNFRKRMWQVIRLLTEVNSLGTISGKDWVGVGIGPLASLEAIETPSATSMLTDEETSSSKTSMWRQLEFGTGVYANPPTKAWRYGRKGLMLRGAKGANALKLPMSGVGVMNKGDALMFEEQLKREFAKLLA